MNQLFSFVRTADENVFETSARLAHENQELLYRIYLCVCKTIAFDAYRKICAEFTSEIFPNRNYVTIDSAVLFGLPNDRRLAYDWHQESNYMPGIPNFVNFWAPVFEPASKLNGAMSFLKGSHKNGTLPYIKKQISKNSYTDLVPTDIARIETAYEEFHCAVDVGDLVVFHPDLIHRSNLNRSQNTRFSAVLRLAALDHIPNRINFSNEIY